MEKSWNISAFPAQNLYAQTVNEIQKHARDMKLFLPLRQLLSWKSDNVTTIIHNKIRKISLELSCIGDRITAMHALVEVAGVRQVEVAKTSEELVQNIEDMESRFECIICCK